MSQKFIVKITLEVETSHPMDIFDVENIINEYFESNNEISKSWDCAIDSIDEDEEVFITVNDKLIDAYVDNSK